MSSSDTLNLPWKIYFFNEDGKYDKDDIVIVRYIDPKYFPLHAIKEHVLSGLEVRVCDSLDHCILHWKDGEKVFPK